MEKINKIDKRNNYLKTYSEEETDIIMKLEDISNSFNITLDNDKTNTIEMSEHDFKGLIGYIDSLYDKKINEKITNYADYLKGVAIAFYREIKNSEISKNQLISKGANCVDWLHVEKIFNNKDKETLSDLDIPERVHEYLIKCKCKWSLLFGIYHAIFLKKIYNFKV